MNKERKYRYFIGIDVSRNELDYAVLEGKSLLYHKERQNTINDIKTFIKELQSLPNFTLPKALFVMEYTGIYCSHLLKVLKTFKANFVQENALHIRNSSGLIRGKYDKIDSVRIARYASKNFSEVKLWVTRRPVIEQLSNLYALRKRLQNVEMALKKPLGEQLVFLKKGIYIQSVALCKNSLNALKNDIESVNNNIIKLVKSDEKLKRLNEIITSVPHVGFVTSVQIILSTNEFTQINDPKKFASYSGVAPFKKESGKKQSAGKVSNIANKKLKSLLHLCAISAIRRDGELKAYYLRKTEEGKPKMSVLNAVRFKLILRIFACLKQDRLYENDYKIS